MKRIIASLLIAFAGTVAASDTYVKPYVDRNGNYHEGHYRTSPNNSTFDNYSTRGNSNPYTGRAGTVSPDYNTKPYESPARQPSYGILPDYGSQPYGSQPAARQKRNSWE